MLRVGRNAGGLILEAAQPEWRARSTHARARTKGRMLDGQQEVQQQVHKPVLHWATGSMLQGIARAHGVSVGRSPCKEGGEVLPSCAHPAPHPHTNTHTTILCATEADDSCSTTHRTRIMHACVPMGGVHHHTQCLDRGRSGGGGVGEGSHDGSCCQPQARTCSFATGVALLMWHRVVQSSSAAVPCSTSQSQAAHTLSRGAKCTALCCKLHH